ncbi:MAG: hypothetical protein LT067_05530 [Sulfurovum sp.]|nr:hypothetical protein [Sulfurovum sp.]
MSKEVDIIEDDILKKYPKVLDILLYDQTTKKNIFWATDNYQHLGEKYQFSSPIYPELITGLNSKIIMPRVLKNKELQRTRVKEMAEVYTPSWVCNKQINSIDNSWFDKENIFNELIIKNDGFVSWKVNQNKIDFPKGKTWKDYVKNIRLEISCGEAPYLASRYDTTTGEYILISNRIGFLDRKLRIINENIKTKKSWLNNVELAYKSTYGYEFHGDSLLLARESLLYTFIENYFEKFNDEPELLNIQKIAYIISWNIWQMDGLKAVVPNSCISSIEETKNLFDDSTKRIIKCKGCATNDNNLHNGIYCLIMDWTKIDPISNKEGLQVKFVDLIQN